MKKKMNVKSKYVIGGILFIALIFGMVLLLFPESYALEGFGEVHLVCDQVMGVGGEEIQCTVTGTVADTSLVSSLSSQIELSENLEFVNFTTNSIWEGTGEDGNIQLYTETNKSGNFSIGTFVVKIKEDVFNTIETISLKENFFYDDAFSEQVIEDVVVNVKTPQFTSEEYDFSKEYIITTTKSVSKIIENIDTVGCNAVVDQNGQTITTGTIVQGAKLKVVSDSKVVTEFVIVSIGSSKYDLKKEYIVDSVTDLENVKDSVETINGSLTVKNEQLVLSYNSVGILNYDILNITSDLYKIDLDKNYILTQDDGSVENISKTSFVTLSLSNGNLNLLYKEEVVVALKLLTVTSNRYKIDLSKGYIDVYGDSVSSSITNNITVNGVTLNVSNEQLVIQYNGASIMNLDVISIRSDEYIMDHENEYLYTKMDDTLDQMKKNLDVVNVTLSILNEKLNVSYDDIVIKSFDLYHFATIYKVLDGILYMKEVTDYADFVKNITLDGLTYKIYNALNQEVSTGNIDEGYSIQIFKDDQLLDTYGIQVEYLEFVDLEVDEDQKIVHHLTFGMTYEELLKQIDTNGTVTVVDKKGGFVSLQEKIKSYDVIRIQLSTGQYEYQLSVFGDLNGTGVVDVGDVSKLYQKVRGKKELDQVASLAGDIYSDGEFLINDVSRLYSYLKGKRPSLS